MIYFDIFCLNKKSNKILAMNKTDAFNLFEYNHIKKNEIIKKINK